jgi:hypothetical protein
MKSSIVPIAVMILLAGILTTAAQSTHSKRDSSDKGDADAADSRSERTSRLPSVFRNCEHPAAWFCTDGPPAAAGESRRVRIRHRGWAW